MRGIGLDSVFDNRLIGSTKHKQRRICRISQSLAQDEAHDVDELGGPVEQVCPSTLALRAT